MIIMLEIYYLTIYIVGMHIVTNKSAPKNSKKIYRSILLRESYRENGKVKKRTIANLSGCKPEEIAAIKLALKYKDNLLNLDHLSQLNFRRVSLLGPSGQSIK